MTQIPTQISFRNMDKPMGIEEWVQESVVALERLHSRITGCRIMIERRHHSHRKGDHFQVRIDLTLPGAELVVNHEAVQGHGREALNSTVRGAFKDIHDQLDDHVRRLRQQTQSADPAVAGLDSSYL